MLASRIDLEQNAAMLANGRLFSPSLTDNFQQRLLQIIGSGLDESDLLMVASKLRSAAKDASGSGLDSAPLRFAVSASLLADLIEQGWSVATAGDQIYLAAANASIAKNEKAADLKSRIRNGLLIASDRQLASGPVRDFIKGMERHRIHKGKIVSIRTIIDDGKEFGRELKSIASLEEESERIQALEKLVKPALEVCETEATCQYTGLKLQDIWRYFRHTWSLEYNPLPGRTLRFLIRNKARPNSPVMGIAMLASPAANLYVRDKWIGWRLDDITRRLLEGTWDATCIAKALLRSVRESISDIRTDDMLTADEVANPTEAAIFRLQQIAAKAAQDRIDDLRLSGSLPLSRLIDIRGCDKACLSDDDWRALSQTALYRKKRAEQLVSLLKALRYFLQNDFEQVPGAALYEGLISSSGREAVKIALNEIRKRRIATEIADLSVCGAIAPYNHLLGGKLVTLLMSSDEASKCYAERYSSQPSEIASQLAGRAVVRSSNLSVLTTTSLYGNGSSQYNRLRLKAGVVPELRQDLKWEELDPTEGYTVTHLSKLTADYMIKLAIASYGRRRINSVFGEGSSPRTRQIREGLNLIGVNADYILKQSIGRRVYACELFPDAREVLIGFDPKARRRRSASVRAITKGWIKRWAANRIRRPETIEQVMGADQGHIGRQLSSRIQRAKLEQDESDGTELNLFAGLNAL